MCLASALAVFLQPLLAKVFHLRQYCVDLTSPTSCSLGTRDRVHPEEGAWAFLHGPWDSEWEEW